MTFTNDREYVERATLEASELKQNKRNSLANDYMPKKQKSSDRYKNINSSSSKRFDDKKSPYGSSYNKEYTSKNKSGAVPLKSSGLDRSPRKSTTPSKSKTGYQQYRNKKPSFDNGQIKKNTK